MGQARWPRAWVTAQPTGSVTRSSIHPHLHTSPTTACIVYVDSFVPRVPRGCGVARTLTTFEWCGTWGQENAPDVPTHWSGAERGRQH